MNKPQTIKPLKYFAIAFLALVLFLCLAVIFIYIAWYQIVTPLEREGATKTFIIEKNQSLKEIAADLEQEKLIRSKFFFVSYVYYKGWAAKLQAGEYSLKSSSSSVEIARQIVGGDIILNEIQVTIPEGFNLKQIDARLAEAGLINEGDLLIQSRKLEGYLFPDTYYFDEYEDLEGIIAKMRDNFNSKVNEEMIAEIERQGKTIDEVVTMASILEKEVRTYYDKQVASGIFWKRIENEQPLQSCATIAYILGVDKWRYSIDDTEIESPYNTYQNAGLPPGPICNPGLDAIKAAIYPISTDYNFFLSKPGTGETVFSRTGEEHNQNKAKYLR